MTPSLRYRWLAVPALLLALAACDQTNDDQNIDDQPAAQDSVSSTADTTGTQERQEDLSPSVVNRTIKAPDCEGDDCASVEIHMIEFDNAPTLSSEVEQRLVRMGNPISESGVDKDALPSTVDAYAESFFTQSAMANEDSDNPRHYYASLEAKEISRHDDLLILQLQSYVMTGGAHGMPGTDYMVIDEKTRQVVTLDDMLEAGQKPAFEAALKNAWQDWQEHSEVGQTLDPINWPFSPSDNAAPLENAMAVTYGVYTLGPYAIGQTTLSIPYGELQGIVKPRFVPEATATEAPESR